MSDYQGTIEVIARAVIHNEAKVLMCRNKGAKHSYFPGGHVELGETAEGALFRELQEELGAELSHIRFIGAVEHVYEADDGFHHELNVVFEATMPKQELKPKEDHLEFYWYDTRQLSTDEQVLPAAMRKAVIEWLNKGEMFWVAATS